MDDDKSNVVTHELLPSFKPHDKKRSSGFETEAGKAAIEGTSMQTALRDRSRRLRMNPMHVDVALVSRVEQLELTAA
jgi:hypothetical protein